MQIAEMIADRHRVCAGVYFAITRKCPLSCAHCCSDSSMSSEEYSGDRFIRFCKTFEKTSRPDYLIISGGEPLLRAKLVIDIAGTVRPLGTKVALGSGLFFASARKVPRAIREALDSLDHLVISIDQFHEREVPRTSVFHVAETLLSRGSQISFQIVAFGENDPYLRSITDAIAARFGDKIPAYVGRIGPRGRGKAVLPAGAFLEPSPDAPCISAAWPTVSYDGTVVACVNQEVVNGPRARHLCLGNADVDTWASVKALMARRDVLRAIRLLGPISVARTLQPERECSGYCSTCWAIDAASPSREALRRTIESAAFLSLEKAMYGEALDAVHISLPGYDQWSQNKHSKSPDE